MLIEPVVPYRRRWRFPRKRAFVPTPPPAGLMLIGFSSITETAGDLECTAVFNTTEAEPLASVSGAVASKWTARYQGNRYGGAAVISVSYNQLMLVLGEVGPEAGPDVISYAADPSDISDTLGRSLAAFEDFPLE